MYLFCSNETILSYISSSPTNMTVCLRFSTHCWELPTWLLCATSPAPWLTRSSFSFATWGSAVRTSWHSAPRRFLTRLCALPARPRNVLAFRYCVCCLRSMLVGHESDILKFELNGIAPRNTWDQGQTYLPGYNFRFIQYLYVSFCLRFLLKLSFREGICPGRTQNSMVHTWLSVWTRPLVFPASRPAGQHLPQEPRPLVPQAVQKEMPICLSPNLICHFPAIAEMLFLSQVAVPIFCGLRLYILFGENGVLCFEQQAQHKCSFLSFLCVS